MSELFYDLSHFDGSLLLMFMQERMLPVLDGIAICSSVVARQFPRVPSPLLRRNKWMVKTVVKYLELSRDLSFD